MENIAHTLCGLRIADLGFREDLKRAAPWVAVISANIPDADSLLAIFGQDVYLTQHRGLTHSFFGWPFIALIGSFLSHKISKASSWWRHLQLWSLGLISHQLLDWITAWGTLLLWPIQTRFAHAWIFIADPMFWIILGVLPSIWKRRFQWEPIKIGRRSLLLFVSWLLFCAMLKEQAQTWAPRGTEVFPAPLAPLFWTGLSQDEQTIEQYWLTPWSAQASGSFNKPTKQQEELLRKDPLADAIFRIARGLVIEIVSEDASSIRVKIRDIAFASWLDPDRVVIGGEFVIPKQ